MSFVNNDDARRWGAEAQQAKARIAAADREAQE